MIHRRAQAVADGNRETRRTHASASNFCRIFEQDMPRLYSLALLLTGDGNAAEQCFAGSLDDCRQATDVFPEWAPAWSRRAVIKRAIRQMRPQPTGADEGTQLAQRAYLLNEIGGNLLQLPVFQRFVFAMSVLEGYSIRECALLLNCHPQEVDRARTAALRSLGSGWENGVQNGSLFEYEQPLAAIA